MGRAEKILAQLVDTWPRWAGVDRMPAGPLAGPPGSGKTTFMRALIAIARTRGVSPLWVRAKECSGEEIVIRDGAAEVLRRVSAVLQFSASDGFKPSFDMLATAPPEVRGSLPALQEWAERKMRPDIAMWVSSRLTALGNFVQGEDVVLPLCLKEEDELKRRLAIGLLYVLRGRISAPVMLDDMLAFVLNENYADTFIAMSRPFILAVNRYLDTRELMSFSPIIVTPDRLGGLYRLAVRDKYVILSDFGRYEVPLREVQRLAEGV